MTTIKVIDGLLSDRIKINSYMGGVDEDERRDLEQITGKGEAPVRS
jgi:hypothetical protein